MWLRFPDAALIDLLDTKGDKRKLGRYMQLYPIYGGSWWSVAHLFLTAENTRIQSQYDWMNKRTFASACRQHSLPCIETVEAADPFDRDAEYIIKDVAGLRSHSGLSVRLAHGDTVAEALLQPDKFVVQPRYRNSADVVSFTRCPDTLCTFRVMTFPPSLSIAPIACLRAPSDPTSIVDNVNAGGCWFAADIANECISHRLDTQAFASMQMKEPEAEALNVPLLGIQTIVAQCQAYHTEHLPDLPGVGWDVAKIADHGRCRWLLVECNTHTGVYPRLDEETALIDQKLRSWCLDKVFG